MDPGLLVLRVAMLRHTGPPQAATQPKGRYATGAASAGPFGLPQKPPCKSSAAGCAGCGRLALLLLVIPIEDEGCRSLGGEHRMCTRLVVVLLTAQVQMPVNHHVLLHLQDLDAVRDGGHEEADDEPAEDHHVLNGQEQQGLVLVAPTLEGVRGEDDDGGVGHHREDAEDVEGGVPRLVVGGRVRHRAPVEEDELLLIQEAL
mmetsp:Transcript_41996/g.132690  ORF Transcript_41996/g.132690 Transcript_41996/m.132690 type:complete len:202 (-) Transcript_41996:1919-2524(-)